MKSALVLALALRPLLPGQAAIPLAPATLEIALVVGVLFTTAGLALQWQLPRWRMSAEERIKDNKLTEAQAGRSIRFYTVASPALIVLGGLILVTTVFGLLE
ncbi:MAG: hypothetical protein Q7S40_08345 [Opitutaceae bacterium]|nr:hypothetical protein [Opitutaceae bacterium]